MSNKNLKSGYIRYKFKILVTFDKKYENLIIYDIFLKINIWAKT